ncbi:hypothetical protein [Planomicrobium okeanokoites]|uniref:hypothetical protein n=1 Tax=Planomicrobium okeanokoites TaxID=244 RepID=UPI0009FC4643|nr:hypothetical protein [Planomicrobium okeanokoites]
MAYGISDGLKLQLKKALPREGFSYDYRMKKPTGTNQSGAQVIKMRNDFFTLKDGISVNRKGCKYGYI